MTLSLYLGIWNETDHRRLKIENVDLDSNVEILKPHLLKELGEGLADLFEFTYCGVLMNDKKPISSYGVTAGVTINATKKPQLPKVSACKIDKITEVQMQEFISLYRSFKSCSSYRSTLHRLEQIEELDKVIEAVPGLQENPVAIAFISKPELFNRLENPKVCWQIAERNPLILTAVRYVMTEFHRSSSSTTFQAVPASGHSYSLDALSDDDEDMDGDGPSTASGSAGFITPAQLAAALAVASARPASAEALQQAPDPVGTALRFASQLQQMRDMGMNDEERNIRALMAANGDVHAAIDLVFSGAFDD